MLQLVRAGNPSFHAHLNELRRDCEPATALYSRLDIEYLRSYPTPWEAIDLSVIWLAGGDPKAGLIISARNNGRRYLMDKGAATVPAIFRTLDLRVSEETLKGSLRRSLKSQVNWGLRELQPQILDATNMRDEDFASFQQLHLEAAGRKTRSDRSWGIQLRMVREKEAFLVAGYLDGQMVSAALFLFSGKRCYSGVGASRRELFDKPLSACIMWEAIRHARQLGLCWMEVGQLYHPAQEFLVFTDEPPASRRRLPTPKELGISDFKAGFRGQTDIRLDMAWSRTSEYAREV